MFREFYLYFVTFGGEKGGELARVLYCKQPEIIVSRSVGRCPPAAYCIHMKHGHFLCHNATVVTKV